LKTIFLSLSLCFIFAIHSDTLLAQSQSDFNYFLSESTSDYKSNDNNFIRRDKNEIELSKLVLFSVYRNLISSQDGSVCKFYPTCSAYCKGAIGKHGIVKGVIHSFDRLSRCNGLSPHKYKIDIDRKRLVDHVR